MSSIGELIYSTLAVMSCGFLLLLPWVCAKMGWYKEWYIVPVSLVLGPRRHIYMWPMSIFFLIVPILFLIRDKELVGSIWIGTAVVSIILTIYMMAFPPRWARPNWILDLENRYSMDEIRRSFRPAWWHYTRQGREYRKRWSKMMDTPHGIDEMVEYARNWKRT